MEAEAEAKAEAEAEAAVPASTRISSSLKRDQEHSSCVNVGSDGAVRRRWAGATRERGACRGESCRVGWCEDQGFSILGIYLPSVLTSRTDFHAKTRTGRSQCR